jgi:hypothetical protein
MRSGRWIRLLAVVVILAIIALMATASRRPALLCVNPDPQMVRAHNYCIMNPFRDRAPEWAAERGLVQLAAGNNGVISGLVEPSAREHFLEREHTYPIRIWRIGERRDAPAGCQITYWVRRGNYGYGDEQVFLETRREAGRWRAVSFSAIY